MTAHRVKGNGRMAASPELQNHNADIPTQGLLSKKNTVEPHK